jgi:hypothetical protein
LNVTLRKRKKKVFLLTFLFVDCIVRLGNKLNNHINNLEWVTNNENRQHAVLNNLIAFDIDLPQTKLSKEEVINIKTLYNTGNYSQKSIALLYNICQQTVSNIIINKSRLRFKNSVT